MSGYIPTLPSRASRAIPLRTRSSFRGAFVTTFGGVRRAVVFESRLELLTAYLLVTSAGVVDIWDQPTPIEYVDGDGEVRRHTADYLVTMSDGRKVLVAVKPAGSATRHDLRTTLGLIRAQMPMSFADEIVLVTDRSFSREQAENAELIHHIGGETDDEADLVLTGLIATLQANTTIGALVQASGLEGRAYRSIIRLIGQGFCHQVGKGHLRYDSRIARSAAQ